MSTMSSWTRFQEYFLRYEDSGFSLDISRMGFSEDFLPSMQGRATRALLSMAELEKGNIANQDENRMVGHYWLRDPSLAPTTELCMGITDALEAVLKFSADVHLGAIRGVTGKRFTDVLSIGIGGSALGPQLVSDALGNAQDPLSIHFLDNTDPDGFSRVLTRLSGKLDSTLVVVISKSGSTKEPRNGLLTVQHAFREAGISAFTKHLVAVTETGSTLDSMAGVEGWLRRFPIYSWVGGRTSVMSAGGLVPISLQGLDVTSFLMGARAMDMRTRHSDLRKNAALLLALMWYYARESRGKGDMVILPYKDCLLLLSRYLQQLIMESLGKERDLDGRLVHQGISVYGNKGSTDQHAYVQQLMDGVDNFFVTFIEVRQAAAFQELEVEPGVTSGDYLQGFFRGTRTALCEKGRDSLTISVNQLNASSLGALIALYERAVGFYGFLTHINAYHQPGVEAGKQVASHILELQKEVLKFLQTNSGPPINAEEIAQHIGGDAEETFHILQHLAANRSANISHFLGQRPSDDRFSWRGLST
ncbi:MAG: glucose-6-phosphate isomerase [Candidatus Xiphinematobacter sp.]|nr:MAG: glucose-6-phosphate isomerase [Candidatus Xiphinematobacter sp.]